MYISRICTEPATFSLQENEEELEQGPVRTEIW